MILWNLYGLAEVSADVTARVCLASGVEGDCSLYQSIGEPLPNCGIHLLIENENGMWKPNDQGEIFVIGHHVAAGYVDADTKATLLAG